jgi:hypothetical protein
LHPEPIGFPGVLSAYRFSRDAGPKRGRDQPLFIKWRELRLEAELEEEQLGRMAMAGLFLTILVAPLPVMLIMAGRELLWHQRPAAVARKTIPISIRARR